MSCLSGLPTVLIQFVITQESTTRTKWRKPWALRVCEGSSLQSGPDISAHLRGKIVTLYQRDDP